MPPRAAQAKDLDGAAFTLDLTLSDRDRLQKRINQLAGRLRDVDGAGFGQLLHARGEMGGVADRGVVRPDAVAHSANNDGTELSPMRTDTVRSPISAESNRWRAISSWMANAARAARRA